MSAEGVTGRLLNEYAEQLLFKASADLIAAIGKDLPHLVEFGLEQVESKLGPLSESERVEIAGALEQRLWETWALPAIRSMEQIVTDLGDGGQS